MRVTNTLTAYRNLERMQSASQAVFKSDHQVATGLKAEKYSEVSDDLSRILTIEESRTKLDSYNKNITQATSYLQAVETNLQSVQDILTEASSLATLALNNNTAEGRAAISSSAEGLAENLYTLMNQKFQGIYLFSGQATSVPPVSETSPKPFTSLNSDTSYYNGDTERKSTLVDVETTMDFGITGDDPAFADLRAGIEALWHGLENNDLDSLEGALDLINSAQESFGSAIGVVGGEMQRLDILMQQNTTAQTFLETQLQELQGVDSSKAISELKMNEVTLEANLMLISRMNEINILNYL